MKRKHLYNLNNKNNGVIQFDRREEKIFNISSGFCVLLNK